MYRGKYSAADTGARVINMITVRGAKKNTSTLSRKKKISLLKALARRILVEGVLGLILLSTYAAIMAMFCGVMVSICFPNSFIGYAISCGGLGASLLMINCKIYDHALYHLGPKYPGKGKKLI